jgi:hypothetical protein
VQSDAWLKINKVGPLGVIKVQTSVPQKKKKKKKYIPYYMQCTSSHLFFKMLIKTLLIELQFQKQYHGKREISWVTAPKPCQ